MGERSMIWVYEPSTDPPYESDITREQCTFCGTQMQFMLKTVGGFGPNERIMSCPSCGWWTYWRQVKSLFYDPDTGHYRWSLYGALATLKQFDLADLSLGIEEVRQYLLAKYAARFEMHPRLFELTVESVFRDLGYTAEATAYTGDGGVDVILHGSDGQTTGVQVKRYRNAIEVEQIRALAGALILGGHTRGIYVTTSFFTTGSAKASKQFAQKGLPVELVDAPGFLDMLKITKRLPYSTYEEWYEENGEPELATIYENESEDG
jgi:restriction system protein